MPAALADCLMRDWIVAIIIESENMSAVMIYLNETYHSIDAQERE